MSFAPLQVAVLSTLEEAGEDDVAALLNRSERTGAAKDVQDLSRALGELVTLGLVAAAWTRDQSTRRWLALPQAESSELFRCIAACVRWDDRAKHWRWTCAKRLRALLTDEGQLIAKRILSGNTTH